MNRVLLVNPNTNANTTRMMADLVRPVLAAGGLATDAITVAHGPQMLTDPAALAAAEPQVVHAVRAHIGAAAADPPNAGEPGSSEVDDGDAGGGERRGGAGGGVVVAVVVAAIGDPGRDRLAELLDVPVVGIGEASILAAADGGRRFGMATSTPLLAESLAALVTHYGRGATFTGVRLTASDPLELAADPERQFRELSGAVHACVEDGAEAIVIAGGPLSETARRLAAVHPTPIIEPLPAAAALVLSRVTRSAGL